MSSENGVRQARSIVRFWQLALVVPVLTACGAEAPVGAEEELGEVEQAFGEASCGVAFANASVAWEGGTVVSGPTYGQTFCTDAFVASGTFNVPNLFNPLYPLRAMAYAVYRGGVADGVTFPCDTMWTRLSVFRKLIIPGQATTYLKLADGPFVVGRPNDNGVGCRVPTSFVDLPVGEAKYKLVGQAGFTTVLQPVGVGARPFVDFN